MSKSNPVFTEVQHALLTHLQGVNYAMPADVGDLRAIVSMAFMCGAAVVMEMGEAGAGSPFIQYASGLMAKRKGFRDMLNMGGKIIQ